MAQTYEFEIVVPEKREDGEVVREAKQVAHASGLLEKPTKEDLLVEHAKAIAEAGAKGSEVSVNVRNFCRD